jgi:hypothetical protein
MRKMFLALVLAAACSSSNAPSAPTASETGSYTLRSLDGHALPASVVEGSTTTDVLSGNLTLANGGVFEMSVVYRVAGQSTSVTNDLAGHYARQGNSLSFSYSNGGANSGTVSADTLRMTNEGIVWLFTRS